MKKIFVLFAFVFAATGVFAADNLKFAVSEDLNYDSNIYLTDGNEKDSFISTTRVFADYTAKIPQSGLKLSLKGMGGYLAYTENSSKNNYFDAFAQADLSNRFFNIGDRFIYTSDPANSELTDRAKRWQNNAFASFETSREKTIGFGVFADDSYDYYIDTEYKGLTRNRVDAGARLFWNLSPKTSIFAEYAYDDISYKTNKVNDSNGGTAALGIEGQIAPKVSGVAKATYEMRDYKNDLAGADNYNDLLGYVVSVEWKPTANNKLRLSGARNMQESTYGINRYFADTLVSLMFSQKVFNKWTAALTVAYENMDYAKEVNNVKRNDDLITVRPEVEYAFKEAFKVGVWYQYRDRDSNQKGCDYNDSKAGLFAKLFF
ncbi:MAG: outer membrane beta-barrel protein [Elusimicrobiota bacterium]|jgi:hypothetical protein|nr:outer membrane beta-barrel protein [Elusimicrobiota bacterium]